LGPVVGGTGDVTLSCRGARLLGGDDHIAAWLMTGKLFRTGAGVGAGTRLSTDVVSLVFGMPVVGSPVLVLGSPVGRGSIPCRVLNILDKDDWWTPWTEKPMSLKSCPGMACLPPY
jgi:hypothetical protein